MQAKASGQDLLDGDIPATPEMALLARQVAVVELKLKLQGLKAELADKVSRDWK